MTVLTFTVLVLFILNNYVIVQKSIAIRFFINRLTSIVIISLLIVNMINGFDSFTLLDFGILVLFVQILELLVSVLTQFISSKAVGDIEKFISPTISIGENIAKYKLLYLVSAIVIIFLAVLINSRSLF